MNKFEKWLLPKLPGYRFDNRFKWGELYIPASGSDFSMEFTRDEFFEKHDLFIIKIPYLFKLYISKKKPCDLSKDNKRFQYGFDSYYWETISFGCGKRRVTFDYPWAFTYYKKEILDFDFNVAYTHHKKTKHDYEAEEKIEKQYSKVYDYKYVTESGEVQNVKATIYVERMTWRMKMIPFKKVRNYIAVSFSSGVGEETNSWVGGCIGCGYEMLKNESPEDTLRRMERERKF